MGTPSTARRIAIGGLLALVTVLVAYAGLVFISPIDLPWQRVTVTMQIEPVLDGTTVRVVGTTNLPDGALIDYGYWRDDAINEGPTGTAEVTDGRFSFENEVSGLRRGRWSIEMSFSTVWGSQQPKHVTDVFGSEGEHLAGPQVYVDSPGDPKQVLVSKDIDLP